MNFNPKKRLPKEITIKSKGNYLYKIGLSLFANGLTKKNRFIHPILLFIMSLLFMFRSIVVILIPEEYEYLLPLIDDLFIALNIKFHGNLLIIIVTVFSLLFQLIHYY